jgi:hypothetical protein
LIRHPALAVQGVSGGEELGCRPLHQNCECRRLATALPERAFGAQMIKFCPGKTYRRATASRRQRMCAIGN